VYSTIDKYGRTWTKKVSHILPTWLLVVLIFFIIGLLFLLVRKVTWTCSYTDKNGKPAEIVYGNLSWSERRELMNTKHLKMRKFIEMASTAKDLIEIGQNLL